MDVTLKQLSVTGSIVVVDLLSKSLSPYSASYSTTTSDDGVVTVTQYIRGYDIFVELEVYAVIQSYVRLGNVIHVIEPVCEQIL